MLANLKILESLMTKNPSEASDYLKYLKFLAIKGTRFQTRAILALDAALLWPANNKDDFVYFPVYLLESLD